MTCRFFLWFLLNTSTFLKKCAHQWLNSGTSYFPVKFLTRRKQRRKWQRKHLNMLWNVDIWFCFVSAIHDCCSISVKCFMNQKYVNEIGKWPKSNFIYHLTKRWCLKKEYSFKDKFQDHTEESELYFFFFFCLILF